MPFYEPGPYEEFVGKVSAAKARPSVTVWHNISQALDEIQRKKRVRFLYIVSAYAATLLLVGGLTIFFLYNTNNEYAASYQLAQISPLKIDNSLPPIVAISHLNSPTPIPINVQTSDTKVQVDVLGTRPTNSLTKLERINDKFWVQFTPKNNLESIPNLMPFTNKPPSKKRVKKDNLPVTSIRSGWVFALYTNPYFSSNTSVIAPQTGITKEMGLWMWGGEVQLKKRISEKVGFVFGLSINPTGQKTTDLIMFNRGSIAKNKDLLSATTSYGAISVAAPRNEKPTHPSGNSAKSTPTSLSDLYQQIYHFEVPLMLTTNFKVNRVGVEFRFGGATGMLVHNKFEVHNELGNFVGETQGVKPYSISAISAVSISIPLANKLSLVVEPYFRLGLVSFNSQASPATYPFNASLRFGLGYSF
ncbi:MAG: hypothetical protein WC951_07955 [Bacteroidales bacterium]